MREQGEVLGVIPACEVLAMLGNWDKFRCIYIAASGYQIQTLLYSYLVDMLRVTRTNAPYV